MQNDDPERVFVETSIVLIENLSGDYLMLRRAEVNRRSRGKWVFPGGKVERNARDMGSEGEDNIRPALRAAVREVREEAGEPLAAMVRSSEIRHLLTFRSMYPGVEFETHLFHVKLDTDDVDIRLSEKQPTVEHDRFVWMKRETIISQIRHENLPLRDHSERPRGREDYTPVTWEIVRRGLIPISLPGTKPKMTH
jgi:8-oxo-dGTP pyrophosphatase MutT (NUDIX family)